MEENTQQNHQTAVVLVHGDYYKDLEPDKIIRQLHDIQADVYTINCEYISLCRTIYDMKHNIGELREMYDYILLIGVYVEAYLCKYMYQEKMVNAVIYINPIFKPYIWFHQMNNDDMIRTFFETSRIPAEPFHTFDKNHELLVTYGEYPEQDYLSKIQQRCMCSVSRKEMEENNLGFLIIDFMNKTK